MQLHVVQFTNGGNPDEPVIHLDAASAGAAMLRHYDQGLVHDRDDAPVAREAVALNLAAGETYLYLSTPGGADEVRWWVIAVNALQRDPASIATPPVAADDDMTRILVQVVEQAWIQDTAVETGVSVTVDITDAIVALGKEAALALTNGEIADRMDILPDWVRERFAGSPFYVRAADEIAMFFEFAAGPWVKADLTSDDHRMRAEFNAAVGLSALTDDAVLRLADRWGWCSDADELAHAVRDEDDVEAVFTYLEARSDVGDALGFSVQVHREDALRYLRCHRPHLIAQFAPTATS